jgi:hypothetical protein
MNTLNQVSEVVPRSAGFLCSASADWMPGVWGPQGRAATPEKSVVTPQKIPVMVSP